MSRVNSKTGTLDLGHQYQIGLETSTVFEKKWTVFQYMHCLSTGSKQGSGLMAGGETPVFANAKKALAS